MTMNNCVPLRTDIHVNDSLLLKTDQSPGLPHQSSIGIHSDVDMRSLYTGVGAIGGGRCSANPYPCQRVWGINCGVISGKIISSSMNIKSLLYLQNWESLSSRGCRWLCNMYQKKFRFYIIAEHKIMIIVTVGSLGWMKPPCTTTSSESEKGDENYGSSINV
mgnify:CR=1 FL=1